MIVPLAKSQSLDKARAHGSLPLRDRFFDVQGFYKPLPLLPIIIEKFTQKRFLY